MSTFKIKLNKGKTLADGSHPVVLILNVGSRTKKISLGYKYTPEEWDFSSGQPKEVTSDWLMMAYKMNQRALEVRSDLLKRDRFTLEAWANGIKHHEHRTHLFRYTDHIIQTLERSGRHGNAQSYKFNMRAFRDYVRQDLEFKEVTTRVLQDYISHLRAQGKSEVTIHSYLKTIRAVFNRARKEEMISWDLYPFARLKLPNPKTRKITRRILTMSEMAQVLNYPPKTRSQEMTLDVLKFSLIMWGMNPVDILEATRDQISSGRLHYKRKKTGRLYSVSIHPEAQKILDKYQGSHLFPIWEPGDTYKEIQNKRKGLGKILRRISQKVGIPVTMYSARKTFATTARELGYSREMIREALGHSAGDVTEAYLNPIDLKDLDQMADRVVQELVRHLS